MKKIISINIAEEAFKAFHAPLSPGVQYLLGLEDEEEVLYGG